MINGRAAVIRIVTCMIGGIVFILVLRNFAPFESGPHAIIWVITSGVWDYRDINPDLLPRPFWGIVGFGALLGLVPGIAWAIDHESARSRFLVWSIICAVIGFILSMAINRTEPMIVFSLAGVYVGGVSALKRLGLFEADEDNQATREDKGGE